MAQADVEKVDLDFLLGVADIISLHLPLTKETKHLISEREIKLMKKNACIINTSRGPLINEKDLYRALKEKWISGAAIDVTETEPIDQNNDLLKLDNIIITPHVSFYSEESLIDLQRNTARGVAQILMGEMTPSILNKSVIEKENYRNKEKNDKA